VILKRRQGCSFLVVSLLRSPRSEHTDIGHPSNTELGFVLGEEPGHEVTGVSAQQRLEALEIPWLGVRESALVLENWRTWVTRTLERFEDGVDYVLAESHLRCL
jgi:hypothetical protein